jgi:hypothetical protein
MQPRETHLVVAFQLGLITRTVQPRFLLLISDDTPKSALMSTTRLLVARQHRHAMWTFLAFSFLFSRWTTSVHLAG